jgi:hypothetical protein
VSGTLTLTPELASRFAAITLGHVTREYPYKPDHIVTGSGDLQSQREQHPIFYGSFDWHGCVLGYWLLCRLYRRFPHLPQAAQIRELVNTHFTEENIEGELAYLAHPMRSTFERPYGWGWLLLFATELAEHPSAEGKRWSSHLAPLADEFARRFVDFLARLTYPVRSGVHSSSAFAMGFADRYAAAAKNDVLSRAVRDKARAWFGGDRACQAWEPSGEDFLSPSLVEVECMRRTLPAGEFADWLGGFFPSLEKSEPAALFKPADVSDRTDGRIVHLDGLNFSRAWCLRKIAQALPAGDKRRSLLEDVAEAHIRVSLPHIDDDYMGSHWLATYATLALEAV